MKRAVLLLIVLVGSIASINCFAQKASDCGDKIKVIANVTNTSAGLKNGKIDLKAESGNTLDSYNFFLSRVGSNNMTQGSKSGFKDLQTGHYDLYIIDRKGCSKQVQVQVK